MTEYPEKKWWEQTTLPSKIIVYAQVYIEQENLFEKYYENLAQQEKKNAIPITRISTAI